MNFLLVLQQDFPPHPDNQYQILQTLWIWLHYPCHWFPFSIPLWWFSVVICKFYKLGYKSDDLLKIIYSEKATKFCEIFTLLLTTLRVHSVKNKVKISQNFVAFSEYTNFITRVSHWWKIYVKKNPLQDLPSSRNVLISTNEST